MARRNPPAQWVLPDVVNPPDHICITVPVPNDRKHIGAFFGAIFNLTSARFWQDDPAHTAKEVAAVWRAIFDDLAPGACDFNVPDIIDEMEYQMSICEQLRFRNGKLQGLCCGEWVDIDGQTGIDIGGPGQEGGGAPQPEPGGGCQTYHAQFSATSQYVVPTVVSAGDTLTFSNAKGSGQDGTVSPWRCVNGLTFFAGACIGLGGTSGGDPAPTINHMALIAKIGTVYYPASSGVITVPGGVSNEQIIIFANDSTLGDNSGSYSLDIEVCNNQTGTFSHTFNFALDDGGFLNIVDGGATPTTQGVWTPGTGWTSTAAATGGGSVEHNTAIRRTLAAPVVLNTAILKFNLAKGTIDPGLTDGLYLQLAGVSAATATHAADTQADGTPITYAVTPGTYSIDSIAIVVYDGWHNPAAPGTSAILTLDVTGQGTDPF